MVTAVGTETERFELARKAFRSKIRTYAYHARISAGIEQEDVESELLITLWRCVQAYDPDNGASFNTFAQRSFQHRIVSLVREHRAAKRYPKTGPVVTLDAEILSSAIDARRSSFSAEDEALLRMSVGEVVDQERGRRRAERSSRAQRARAC